MTNSSIKQQQLQQQQAGIYEYILVRLAAAYSIIIIIDQVQVLCCKPAHGVHVTKREEILTQSSSSSNASSTMHVHKTDFSIAQTTLQ